MPRDFSDPSDEVCFEGEAPSESEMFHSRVPPEESTEVKKNTPPVPAVVHGALRIPPHSLEAEQSVLGALLLECSAFDAIGDVLTAEDFYRYEHQRIFQAIAGMVERRQTADVITVFERLQVVGDAENCGGLRYLNALANSVPGAANILNYARIVRERSILRGLVRAGDEISTMAFNPAGAAVSDVIDFAEKTLYAASEAGSRGKKGFIGMDALMVALIDEVQGRADRGGDEITGVASGYVDLDRMTAGLQPSDLIILAARPSMGKTALALNVAEHVAIKGKLPVLIFSMEMSAGQLSMRMMGSVGNIDQQHLRTGKLTDGEFGRMSETLDVMSGARIFIDDTPALSSSELRSRARRQARLCGGKLGLIVVDYLQLMTGVPGNKDGRTAEVSEISRGLKALAKELDVPIIALSQLNRAVEARSDKRPMMSDLRESGSIEQDADIIMFIYRDDYYNKDSKEPGVAEIILSKHRNGPVGTVKLAFLKQHTKFANLAPQFH